MKLRSSDLPRLGQSFTSTNDKTSSDSTTDSNHSNMTRFETTVKMLVVIVVNGTISSNDGDFSLASLELGLAIFLVAVMRTTVRVGR